MRHVCVRLAFVSFNIEGASSKITQKNQGSKCFCRGIVYNLHAADPFPARSLLTAHSPASKSAGTLPPPGVLAEQRERAAWPCPFFLLDAPIACAAVAKDTRACGPGNQGVANAL